MIPGKPGFERVKWCFENTLAKPFSMLFASADPQGTNPFMSQRAMNDIRALFKPLQLHRNDKYPFGLATMIGVSLPLEFPESARATPMTFNIQSTPLKNVIVPDAAPLRTIGKNDLRWRRSVSDLYEWIGLASMHSDR